MPNEIVDNLEKNGWDVTQKFEWHLGNWPIQHPVKTSSVYLFEKTYLQADNIGVRVSIHPYHGEFVIIDSAEHRTSGPSVTVEGVVKTIDEALLLAQSSCQYWDDRLNVKSHIQR